MSPPRRRSARLASSTKPRATPDLPSVNECEETPSRQSKYSNVDMTRTPKTAPGTPASSAIKPAHDEMHPSKARLSTAQPSTALELGFSDIHGGQACSTQPITPSRTSNAQSCSFDFQLSAGAQKMMNEIRQQAAKYKAEIVAQREADGESGEFPERKIAKAKGKSGRFSAAHIAEFKKMDSIEGHASAWRAQNFTPVTCTTPKKTSTPTAVDSPASVKRGLKRTSSKANLDETPNSRSRPNLKHGTAEVQPESPSPRKVHPLAGLSKSLPVADIQRTPSAKRTKKNEGDDASNARPISRDGGSLPRPVAHVNSSLNRLMSPTKSSLVRAGRAGKPTINLVPAAPEVGPKSLSKSVSMQNLSAPSPKGPDFKRRIISPSRLDKVKNILRGRKPEGPDAKTAIPAPMPNFGSSLTPKAKRSWDDKELPPIPLTTPRRKLMKHVTFTPEVSYAPSNRGTPTPQRVGILKYRSQKSDEQQDLPGPESQGVHTSTKRDTEMGDVVYPDLSGFKDLVASQDVEKTTSEAPGTFTFRSDHTIEFGDSCKRFGPLPGLSSIRQVRQSEGGSAMPGSFPKSHPNKENREPSPAKALTATAHGMSTKKRARPSTDEEDAAREAEERAAKKRKNENVPEGSALFVPRLLSSAPSSAKKAATPRTPGRFSRTPARTPVRTPSRTPSQTPGSTASKPMLSLSRLNMLARPKARS